MDRIDGGRGLECDYDWRDSVDGWNGGFEGDGADKDFDESFAVAGRPDRLAALDQRGRSGLLAAVLEPPWARGGFWCLIDFECASWSDA